MLQGRPTPKVTQVYSRTDWNSIHTRENWNCDPRFGDSELS